jgi:hypothetical protein
MSGSNGEKNEKGQIPHPKKHSMVVIVAVPFEFIDTPQRESFYSYHVSIGVVVAVLGTKIDNHCYISLSFVPLDTKQQYAIR